MTATPEAQPLGTSGVQINDEVIARRVRRPLDLARFVLAVALTGAIIGVGWFATSTTAGLEDDVTSGVQSLPSAVILALNVIGGIGTLGLPIAAGVALVVRRRARQLFDAVIALLAAVVLLTVASAAVSNSGVPRLLVALAGSTSPDSASTAPILGGLIAFITVARLLAIRPWSVLSYIVIGSVIIVTVLSSGIALAGVGVSIALGWAIGLLTRYALGTPTTRPTGQQVADALARGGYPLISLDSETTTARGRRYRAVTRSGARLRINVLDRDLEGAGLVLAFWTALRLRDEPGTGAFNMRRTLDHAALIAFAAAAAGVPTPRLLLATEIGPDSSLLAYEFIDGELFTNINESSVGGALSDADLQGAWRAVRTLHEHQSSHRALSADHLLRATDGSIWIVGHGGGSIAASDVAQRIDLAELLCTLALLTSVERSVEAGRLILGVDALTRALPALQPVALSGLTRKAVRKNRQILVLLRDTLLGLREGGEIEQIRLERVRPRTLLMIIVGSIAGYLLLSQLAQVDLVHLFSTANWGWVLLSLILSLVTFLAAVWSLTGFVPERIPIHRTFLAQLAGAFATLVSPPTLGSVAINMRFLQKAGLHPALAAASVGVSQVMAFTSHILLLFVFGIAAGTQSDLTFNPPRIVVIAVIAVAACAIALLAVPAVRKLITTRVGPILKEVGPRLVTVAQRPGKLIEGVGGILLLNLAFIGVLYAAVNAFGGQLGIALVAVVYLAGATIGQAAPTPGGLGAVEAALAAGLTAAGLDGGIAVSAVLLFRLVTFWLPTVPGYFAFNWLTKKGAL